MNREPVRDSHADPRNERRRNGAGPSGGQHLTPRPADASPLPPLPGESAALVRARELIRRGPGSPREPVLPAMPQPDAPRPVPPPQRIAAKTQRAGKAVGKTYLRPDGTPVPDRRPSRHSADNVPPTSVKRTPEAPSAPMVTPVRAAAPAEIILELPTAYVTSPASATAAIPRPGVGALSPLEQAEPAPSLDPSLPAEECPTCHGSGFLRLDVPLGHPSFGKAVPCACREREMARRRRNELWKLSRLDAFTEMTFATFNPNWPGVREIFAVAREYAAEQEPPWLLFSGRCGSGKTHLAAAIANERFAQGDLVLFAVVPQLLDHLRATFAPSSETTYDALFEKVREAGLLVLDDLGAEHSTPWAQEKLFQIINHRYIHALPTVVTTNQPLNALDDRIRSRLSDIRVVRHLAIDADDYRPRNAPMRRRAWDEPAW